MIPRGRLTAVLDVNDNDSLPAPGGQDLPRVQIGRAVIDDDNLEGRLNLSQHTRYGVPDRAALVVARFI